MKKPLQQRVGDFLDGKGFYIVLFLCVAAIGLSGYYLVRSLGSGDEDTLTGGPAQITVTPVPTRAPATPVPTSKPVSTPAASAAATPRPTPAATPAPTAAATPAPSAPASSTPTVFVWPVQGEVLTSHSLEVLGYDMTMADWRTHTGVDLAAAAGTQVRSAAAGTVQSVTQDVMMGTTVVIDHGDGVIGTYSNLASVPTVEAGDSVMAGSVIGSVGDTAIAESALPDHLHFTLSVDGQPVDPLEYLPE